jgi:hypothetical protein
MTNLLEEVFSCFFAGFTFVAFTYFLLATPFDKKVFHLHSPFYFLTCLSR